MGTFLIYLPFLLVSITVHEFAHGWVAYLCGDHTARRAGRLTLNPLAHVDVMGMLVVPLVLALAIGIPFGWAKPVPVNPMMLGNPKRDMIWVALAGPLANVILALFAVFGLKGLGIEQNSMLQAILLFIVMLNMGLALLNVIPIPPLDGSRVLMGLLPRAQAMAYAKLQPYGFIIMVALIYLGFVGQWMRLGIQAFFKMVGI